MLSKPIVHDDVVVDVVDVIDVIAVTVTIVGNCYCYRQEEVGNPSLLRGSYESDAL